MNKLLSRIVSAVTAVTVSLFSSSGSIHAFINEIDTHAVDTDVILGDVNDDRRVDIFDLTLIKQEIANPGATNIDKTSADVNIDGILDNKDALEINQFLLVERDSFTGTTRKV